MTISKEYEFGSVEYWQKRADTKQQIIDRQRNKITRLERQLAASERRKTSPQPETRQQSPQALADTPDQ